MDHIALDTPWTLPATNGYHHVAGIAPGSRLVWTSGQVPLDAEGNAPAAGDWEGQTRQVMRNVGTALEAGGATWSDVFKLTIFVIDGSELATVHSVRDEFVNVDNPPTSSLVQVAGLIDPSFLVAIEAVAAVAAPAAR
jgi:enamine deaminase RidA (YjgF/YER057c/UK114 family)